MLPIYYFSAEGALFKRESFVSLGESYFTVGQGTLQKLVQEVHNNTAPNYRGYWCHRNPGNRNGDIGRHKADFLTKQYSVVACVSDPAAS